MAISKCLGCGSTRFEMREHEPAKSGWKYNFIQCASCGGVVGVVDYLNTSKQTNDIIELLKDIQRRLR